MYMKCRKTVLMNLYREEMETHKWNLWTKQGTEKLGEPEKAAHCVRVLSHSVMSDSLRPQGPGSAGSPVQGILQAKILEQVPIPFFEGSS